MSQSSLFSIEEYELISLLPTGLDDRKLKDLFLKGNLLPPKISTEIKKILDVFFEPNSKKCDILLKLFNETLSYSPTTRDQYLWYLKFTAIVLLLNDLPLTFCTVQGHLLTNVFNMPTALWDGSPIKIHYFASGVYDVCENDSNMMFVINQIESKSRRGVYMSIVMLWKSLYRCIDENKQIFLMYPPSNLLEITAKMGLNKLETNFEKYYSFISLFSKLVNLVFHRKLRSVEYVCYNEFFVYDVELVKSLRTFLERIVREADDMWRKNNENLNILSMIELLQIDISEFDNLTKDTSDTLRV